MIDELDVVRRLGADEATPDAAVRERVRARVLEDPRRPAPRRRRRLWSVSVLAPAAAAALAVALVLTLNPGGDDFSGDREEAAALPSLFPGPDEFLYVRSRSRYIECRPSRRCRMGPEASREIWVSERRRGRLIGKPADDLPPSQTGGMRPTSARLGPVPPRIGNRRFSHAELARYAPSPGELLELLQRDRVPRQGDSGDSYPFRQITDALSGVAMPPKVRGAMLEALPLVPGVKSLGSTTEARGRRGLAYARVVEGQRETIIVDPRTATLLEQRIDVERSGAIRGLKAGDLAGREVYLERAVVDRAGRRPR